jgi:hypothetical protein
MGSPIDKKFYVTEFMTCISGQRAFRKRFNKNPPPRAARQGRVDNSENQGYYCMKKSDGHSHVSEDELRHMETNFNQSPKTSVQKASLELQMPNTTLWQVQCRQVCMKTYKLTITWKLEPEDCPNMENICKTLQAEMAFRDHTIFHSGLPHPACGVLKIM